MSSKALIFRTLSRSGLYRSHLSTVATRQLRAAGVQVIHPVGISTRYRSISNTRLNLKNSTNHPSRKGSADLRGHGDTRRGSRVLFDLFVSNIETQNARPGADKVNDDTLKKLQEWASGEYFPPDLLKPVKQWSANIERLFSDLPPAQVTLLLDAFEMTHKKAWSILYKNCKVQRRPVPRSRRYQKYEPNLRTYNDLKKFKSFLRDAKRAKKAIRWEVERINGTQASILVTLRISNAIKACMVFCNNIGEGRMEHVFLTTEKRREGGDLAAYIRKVMPRVDPIVDHGSSVGEEVHSIVKDCVRLMYPEFEVTITRESVYPAGSNPTANPSEQIPYSQSKGKRGFRQTLSSSRKSRASPHRKAEPSLASKISRNAWYLFRSLSRAKMDQEIVNPSDSRDKD